MANLDDLLKKFDLEKGSTKLTTNERMRKEIKGYITDPKQFEKGLLAIAELSREGWTLSVGEYHLRFHGYNFSKCVEFLSERVYPNGRKWYGKVESKDGEIKLNFGDVKYYDDVEANVKHVYQALRQLKKQLGGENPIMKPIANRLEELLD